MRLERADEAICTVSLRPFGLDPTPVTNEAFARFVQATGRRAAAEIQGVLYSLDPAHGRANVGRGQNWRTLRAAAAARGERADALPVLGVDLESARAYCEWKDARLPTEDEWEYSARGPSGRVFPRGDQPEPPAQLPNRACRSANLQWPASLDRMVWGATLPSGPKAASRDSRYCGEGPGSCLSRTFSNSRYGASPPRARYWMAPSAARGLRRAGR